MSPKNSVSSRWRFLIPMSLLLVAGLLIGLRSISGLAASPKLEPEPPTGDELRGSLPLPKSEGITNAPAVSDPVIQSAQGITSMPATIMNWEGIPSTGVYPPDTDGQVGANHYVQIVNASGTGSRIRVWDKAGNQLYDFGMNGLWPSGDRCNTYGYGDPVVLYDQLADRWLLTQFTYPSSGPYNECIAVSKTGTPTNISADWYLYTFNVHSTKFNDYPKLGVWPDGYYMMAHQFTSSWAGTGVWVFNRAKMLDGTLSQAPSAITCSVLSTECQYKDLYSVNASYGGMLPVNLMGDRLPPAGSPNYFVEVDYDWYGGNDIMTLFGFQVDWDTPANTKFGRVGELVVADYDYQICSAYRGQCIDQPGTTVKLEGLADRLMMHAWYRNMGDYESIVLNHTVDGDGAGHAGIRWYEVRKTDPGIPTIYDPPTPPSPNWGLWSLYQQGTFAPDTHHRWMGSIAMDHFGNIALGYSVSSASVYPGIRYAGRLSTDPLGILSQGEAMIVDGGGSQTGSGARWGDYSAMSVDPVDDCTFWYTQEYMQTTSANSWQTRVAAFKFPNCQKGPNGVLEGHVQAADSGAALAGALIEISASLTQTYQTVSDVNGDYVIQLPVDTSTVTVSTHGYYDELAPGISIAEGMTTIHDAALTPLPIAVIEGNVIDADTGWPLYARLDISNAQTNKMIFSDPVTGYYSITLYQDIEYNFAVNAISAGYISENTNIIAHTSPYTQNFDLEPDLTDCTAPGYEFVTSVCSVTADGLGVGSVQGADTGAALNQASISGQLANTATTFATPDDQAQPDGFYIIGLSGGINDLTASHTVYGPVTEQVNLPSGTAVRQDFQLPSANLVPNPASLQAELLIDTTADLTLVISNTGSFTGTFELSSINTTASAPTLGQALIPTRRFSPKHLHDLDASWFDLYQPTETGTILAGQVLQTYPTGLNGLWGLGVNPRGDELWLGSNSINGGDEQLHKFTIDGSNTGVAIDLSPAGSFFGADMAYDPFTASLWQVDAGGDNCIYAIHPETQQVTGERICPLAGAPQRGLAYDLSTNTFYLGSWNDGSIHHVDFAGNILDSKNINVNISGLAFNPMTHHLFALSNADKGFDIYVLDVDADYAILGGFDIAGLGDFSQAGLGIDCEGNLWLADQLTNQIIKASSGEAGICNWAEIPWLSAAPISGTIPAGETQAISITLDATDLSSSVYNAQIRVDNNNPEGEFFIPVTLNVSLPAYGVSVTPEIDALTGFPGQTITYYVDITNVGKNIDVYNVDVESAWGTGYSPVVGPLTSGQISTITVTVTIPERAPWAQTDMATITLMSQTDENVSQSANLTTMVKAANTIYLPYIAR